MILLSSFGIAFIRSTTYMSDLPLLASKKSSGPPATLSIALGKSLRPQSLALQSWARSILIHCVHHGLRILGYREMMTRRCGTLSDGPTCMLSTSDGAALVRFALKFMTWGNIYILFGGTMGRTTAPTYKIGNSRDSMAVVDTNGRVHAVQDSRIVGASISPFLPPDYLQATIMI